MLFGPDGQPINSTKRLPVEATLTGQGIEVVTVYDALAITAPGDNVSTIIDTSSFKYFSIMARSSHDAPVTLRVTSHAGAPAARGTFMWFDDGDPTAPGVEIPAQQDRWFAIHTHPAIERFIQFGLSRIRFNATAMPNNLPTQGSLTLQIWGVPN